MAASGRRLNLPNIITLVRIAACPVIFYLALSSDPRSGFAAFVLFVIAAVTDLWDGYLARKNKQVTDVGKLLDPIADKLLLFSTFIPLYIVSHRVGPEWPLPFWGALSAWIVGVIFGREILITLFRSYAVRKGLVIAAGPAGKYKAFVQNLFIGGGLLWYPLTATARSEGWTGGFWRFWVGLHSWWILVMLSVALFLTVYSMGVYLWNYRQLLLRNSSEG
jgi:CDP-diacylglycerol--glycerol-3-phosphate 3-phosphatidyltransferase